MKQITLFIFLQFACFGFVSAQCMSSSTNYDLIVNTTQSLSPTSTSFISAIICNGGNLYDSLMCCTRIIHVQSGGMYQAGPQAYGMLYLKSGSTFDGHGNNNFFAVNYEAGATILNYSGPMTLCTAVYFDSTACLLPSGIAENHTTNLLSVYPDPCTDVLSFEAGSIAIGSIMGIFDITGKKVLEYSISKSGKNQIDVSSLAPGVYTYSVSGKGSETAFGKFAVVR